MEAEVEGEKEVQGKVEGAEDALKGKVEGAEDALKNAAAKAEADAMKGGYVARVALIRTVPLTDSYSAVPNQIYGRRRGRPGRSGENGQLQSARNVCPSALL